METQPQPQGGLFKGYSSNYKPLVQYALLVVIYLAGIGSLLVLAWQRQALPERISLVDLSLLAIATHKLARLITKDWVTSPFRAPFTRFKQTETAGEVSEESRGTGMRVAIGDLVTCPWCINPWVSAGLFFGFAFAPTAARLIAAIFTAVTVSDFLHHLYVKIKGLTR